MVIHAWEVVGPIVGKNDNIYLEILHESCVFPGNEDNNWLNLGHMLYALETPKCGNDFAWEHVRFVPLATRC